jgi:hypothetical protein
MQNNQTKAACVKQLFYKLLQMKTTAERGIAINQEELQRDELALVRLLDGFRPSSACLPAFNELSRAYLVNRMHSLIPEKNLLYWKSHGLREAGLDQVKRTAFILMAAGAGSRLESLRDMDGGKWTELGLEDLSPSDFKHFSKATAPMGPVSKCATTELLLQSILAIARKSETQVPVILSYDNKSEFRLMKIMKRWSESDHLLIYLKKESFGLPAIDNDGNLLFDDEGTFVVGSGGPGGSLRALGEPGFIPLHREPKHFPLFDHLHSYYPHIDTLCFMQTDMPISPEVLLAVLGAKKEKKVQVSLAAYDYPSGFQLGVVTNWKTPRGREGFEIVDFIDRTPEFDRLVRQSQAVNKPVPAYSGLMAFDLELGERTVKSGLFRPEIHWNKNEKGLDGLSIVINKVVLSLTDVVIEANTLSIIMMPLEELLPGKTPEAFAKCREVLSRKGQLLLNKKGFEVDDRVIVELSPLAGTIQIGEKACICDRAKIYFTGPLNQRAEEVIFGNQVTIKENVTVIFEGKYPVHIAEGSVLGGEGTIIFGRTPSRENATRKPLIITPSKGQIVEVSC